MANKNAIEVKIQSAISILKQLGLPIKQQNERSARTLLALLNLKPEDKWKDSKPTLMGIHELIEFIAKYYDFRYAENSRESIRRQTIHQFEQAGIIVRNSDNPSRPTNSGKTVYIITDLACETIKSFNSYEWAEKVEQFKGEFGSLTKKYMCVKEQEMVPLIVDGVSFVLSAGKHNVLQAQIINEFGPRFAPGAHVLYLGDTARKTIILKEKNLAEMGIPVTKHAKLPDIVLFLSEKKWVYLIEAVTSHGPVSPKRHHELELALKTCPYGRVYVSAFPDFKTFNKFANDIAWETEAWVADAPDHLIHFNGDRFLGPHR